MFFEQENSCLCLKTKILNLKKSQFTGDISATCEIPL